jgi:hypothetical protein
MTAIKPATMPWTKLMTCIHGVLLSQECSECMMGLLGETEPAKPHPNADAVNKAIDEATK